MKKLVVTHIPAGYALRVFSEGPTGDLWWIAEARGTRDNGHVISLAYTRLKDARAQVRLWALQPAPLVRFCRN